MKKIQSILAVLTLVLFMSYPAHAAQDGQLGATSIGKLDITLKISNLVRISHLDDLDFGTYNGVGDLSANDDVCVYRNGATGRYQVTAAAVEGKFAVKSPDDDEIPYDVFFNDKKGTNGGIQLAYNTTSSTQTGANTESTDCFNGKTLNANIRVDFDSGDLQSAPEGSYKSTLLVAVEPV